MAGASTLQGDRHRWFRLHLAGRDSGTDLHAGGVPWNKGLKKGELKMAKSLEIWECSQICEA